MSLREVSLKNEYRSLLDNVARDFYVPLLKEAVSYKRAVGFFSSSALVEITKGIGGLVKNGGTIQLVASPYLSEDDVAAIRIGYEKRDKIIKAAILREMTEVTSNLEGERLNLLASLIADGILDIKIAFIEDERKMGMYHEKMGIIADAEGNMVAFSGSNNESATAMFANYETIDVFCSWNGDGKRVAAKENAFNSIWNNCEPNLKIIEFPELRDELIVRYKKGAPNFDIDTDRLATLSSVQSKKRTVAVPSDVELFDYQLDAIAEWGKECYRGIFDMATGTGKTYTGLGAIVELSKKLDDHLAVFIVAPFQHLVEQWVEDIVRFGIDPIIGYSASNQKDWKKRLENAVRDQKLRVRGREFFCFVSTNATFSSKYVQSQIEKLRGNALLVIDEAHNFGAETYAPLLSEQFNYRLALSATLDRHNDEIGTAKLYDYFGNKCIEYPLDRAIEEKKLTQYKYYPVVVTLNDAELEQYDNLTYEMSKCIIKGKNGKVKLSERGKIIAMNRARLVAGAENKLQTLNEKIVSYENDKHILVYCGATKVLKPDEDFTEVDEDDMRQIDAVTHILGNVHHMDVAQFTSREDMETRKRLKKEFGDGDTLQVLVAIKCLDEGVNIPQIKTAFILASTTNPKEYIQRRGRVLRRSPGKEFAEIYDFITLPRPLNEVAALTEGQLKREMTLVNNELCRAEEFACIALNMVEAEATLGDIKSAYGINEHQINFEEDYGYDE